MAESYIQVAPNSTGGQVRNLTLTVREIDGDTGAITDNVRYMQVVNLADENGRVIDLGDFEDNQEALKSVLFELRIISQLLVDGLGIKIRLDELRNPDSLL